MITSESFFKITSLSFAAQYFEFCFLFEMLNKLSVSNWWKMQTSFKNLRCTKIIGAMFWLESSLRFVSDNNNGEALFQMTDGDDWMTLRRGPSFSCCTTCALVLGFLQPGAAPPSVTTRPTSKTRNLINKTHRLTRGYNRDAGLESEPSVPLFATIPKSHVTRFY